MHWDVSTLPATTAAGGRGFRRVPSGTTSLDYNLRVFENLFVVGGSLVSTASYRRSFDQGYGDADAWARLVLNDYGYSKLDLRNTFASTLYPLTGDGVFGQSNISYSLGWTVFRYQLEDSVQLYDVPVYSLRGPEWSPEGVTQIC